MENLPPQERVTFHDSLNEAFDEAKDLDVVFSQFGFGEDAYDFTEYITAINTLNTKYSHLYNLGMHIVAQEMLEGTDGDVAYDEFDEPHMHFGEMSYSSEGETMLGIFKGFVLLDELPINVGGSFEEDGDFRFGVGVSIEYDQNLINEGNRTTVTIEHLHHHYPVRSSQLDIIDPNITPNLELVPTSDPIFEIIAEAQTEGRIPEEQLAYIAEHAEIHIGLAPEPLKKAYAGLLDQSGIIPKDKLIVPERVFFFNENEGTYAELFEDNIKNLTTDTVRFGFSTLPVFKDKKLTENAFNERLALIADTGDGGEVIIPISDLVLFDDIPETTELYFNVKPIEGN